MLRAAGFTFEVQTADVDEQVHAGEEPEAYVRRVSETKARAVAPAFGSRAVLAADTVVVVDDEMLGKPVDANDATRMLRRLSGRPHLVMTGVSLAPPRPAGVEDSVAAATLATRVARTTVEFAPLSDDEVAWYVGSGEPMGKAGGYAIQGLASRFAVRIDGSYSNVVGLPIALVWQMCKGAGILVS